MNNCVRMNINAANILRNVSCLRRKQQHLCTKMPLGGRFGSVWRHYSLWLDTRPLFTQAATTGIVCGLGDCIAQLLLKKEGSSKKYDLVRTARMSFIGFSFTGPVLRVWFISLDRMLGPTLVAGDAVKKVLLDQLLFAPVLTGALLTLFSYSRGMDSAQVKEKLKEDYSKMLLGCYCIWPVTQMFNFYYVPLKYRVGFTNVVSLAWNTFVARLANSPTQSQDHNFPRKDS